MPKLILLCEDIMKEGKPESREKEDIDVVGLLTIFLGGGR
jgi:hypothetical protein